MIRNFLDVPGAKRLFDSHENYLTAVVRGLLDRAVGEGHLARVDTAAVAHVLGGLGQVFSRAHVSPSLEASPKQTANDLTEIILRGLEER